MSTITKLEGSETKKVKARKMTEEQMLQDIDYKMVQKCTQSLLDKGLISEEEFNKITALNKESFSPYLVELMG